MRVALVYDLPMALNVATAELMVQAWRQQETAGD